MGDDETTCGGLPGDVQALIDALQDKGIKVDLRTDRLVGHINIGIDDELRGILRDIARNLGSTQDTIETKVLTCRGADGKQEPVDATLTFYNVNLNTIRCPKYARGFEYIDCDGDEMTQHESYCNCAELRREIPVLEESKFEENKLFRCPYDT